MVGLLLFCIVCPSLFHEVPTTTQRATKARDGSGRGRGLGPRPERVLHRPRQHPTGPRGALRGHASGACALPLDPRPFVSPSSNIPQRSVNPTARDARGPRLTLRPRAASIPTPQFIPSIEADSDDDDSSDGELPIFFTSTEPGAPSSSAARHGADSASSGATHTARAAPVHRDEGDELAAFECAASEALRREEERSARIVAAHLAPDEHRHPPDDDDPFDDSDSDSDSDSDAARGSVRARPRRAPRPATARRAPMTPPPTNVADAVSSLFDGWLSGAAGRLASGVRSTTEGRLDSAAGDPPAVSSSFDTVAHVEREFASRATLDADGNLPGAVRANMPRPSVSLNLDGSLGGVDLDALLARLQTPEGLAEVRSGRAGGEVDGDWDGDGDAVRADDVAFGLVDDDDRYDRYDGGVPGMVPAAATAAARAEAASSSARTTANGAVAASSLVGGRGGGWRGRTPGSGVGGRGRGRRLSRLPSRRRSPGHPFAARALPGNGRPRRTRTAGVTRGFAAPGGPTRRRRRL